MSKDFSVEVAERATQVLIADGFANTIVRNERDEEVRARLVTMGYKALKKTFGPQHVRTESEPATLWDRFKAVAFPRWLKRVFPIKYLNTHITIQVSHVCPHLPIEVGVEGGIHWEFLKGKSEGDGP